MDFIFHLEDCSKGFWVKGIFIYGLMIHANWAIPTPIMYISMTDYVCRLTYVGEHWKSVLSLHRGKGRRSSKKLKTLS